MVALILQESVHSRPCWEGEEFFQIKRHIALEQYFFWGLNISLLHACVLTDSP